MLHLLYTPIAIIYNDFDLLVTFLTHFDIIYLSKKRKAGDYMAKNPPKGPGRKGAVKNRRQSFNSKIKKWIKFNDDSGKIMDVKSDSKPFKGIRKK